MTREEFEHAFAVIEAERARIRFEADEKEAELHAKALEYFGVAIGDVVISRGAKYEVRSVCRVWRDSVTLYAAKLKKDGTPSALVTAIYDWSKP